MRNEYALHFALVMLERNEINIPARAVALADALIDALEPPKLIEPWLSGVELLVLLQLCYIGRSGVAIEGTEVEKVAIGKLLAAGFIEPDGLKGYFATEEGLAHVKKLCQVAP